MKHRKIVLAVLALGVCMLLVTTPASQAQTQNSAQAQKLNMVVKQLNLSPEQKIKLMPILEDEAPKVEAIKANTSLTNLQKWSGSGRCTSRRTPRSKQFCRRSSTSNFSKSAGMSWSRPYRRSAARGLSDRAS
jgi:outer membrane murein-binding lipoprotein Lpp